MAIFYGTKKIKLGTEEYRLDCPSCEKDQPADVTTVSHYFYIYWIPIIPVDKTATIKCRNCGLTRTDLNLKTPWLAQKRIGRRNFRHPWYTYTGLVIIIVIAVYLILKFVKAI